MPRPLPRWLLPFYIFISGGCVLIIEVTAVRLLAIYFGNTLYMVSSILTVILLALSVGYYYGGRWANPRPSLSLFFRFILFSGIGVMVLELLHLTLMPWMGYALPLLSGPLMASMVLFFPAAFLLGLLTPYAIALQYYYTPNKGVGPISGTFFFFSTLGSIVGSLLTGFYLIPQFGVNTILIATGVLLFLLGFLPLIDQQKINKRLLGLFLFFLFPTIFLFFQPTNSAVIYNKEGIYSHILVYDSMKNDQPVRYLLRDKNNSSAIYLHSHQPVFNYVKFYTAYQLALTAPRSILILGGGAYTLPQLYLTALPKSNVDTVEIEPQLLTLAEQYFQFKPSARFHNITEDARRYLKDHDKRYDLIFCDAFQSLFSIPFHLTTGTFFELIRDRLTPNGMVVANFIGSLAQDKVSFLWSAFRTFRMAFPESYFFAVNSPHSMGVQNFVAVGFVGNHKPISEYELAKQEVFLEPKVLRRYALLTDDYAPVDYWVVETLKHP